MQNHASKGCCFDLSLTWVFLNRSSVYVVQTISHQPLLLSRRRQDRTWTISMAKFCLRESNKVPAKDKRRAICRLLNAMSICALSENILLRSFSREIALIRAIFSFTATIFKSWIMARRYYIGPRPFSFSLLEIKIRFDTQCAVSIRCHSKVAPKSKQTQLGSAWVERRLNRALLKSTNQHLSEDLLSRGVPDLQNRSQHLLTTLFSQQHNYKLRILKIWQTIKLIERIKLPKSDIVVSMDVTSLYTNIPQREGITTVCHAYEEFHQGNPPVPARFLSEMLSLILN